MKYMKKGSLGILVETSAGASDPELTEVRLSAAEYADMQKRIKTAEQAQLTAEENVEYCGEQLEKYKNLEKEMQYKIDDVERQLERVTKEKNYLEELLKRQINLNGNLKRIARERANAQRGLVPKKEHSGYVVLSSVQCRVHHDNGVTYVWRSILQTPYDASLPYEQIADDIWAELRMRILKSIGIFYVQLKKDNGIYKKWTDIDDVGKEHEVCGLYRWCFKANYVCGLWEMTMYHTQSLYVPEEYRPVRR
ncbi:hypothetical protein [Blautia sp. MSJ-9]|uniref:hypothetical protein n=1 Tax=Blautia sp. MSJ-9 TaxID=2841511 RepID=UPI001C108D5F|nr:hypothetical protein [Blautia sp. MSJ-9]MBU5678996.1 hypothetical protein [Blautia sp. MSJ-9]